MSNEELKRQLENTTQSVAEAKEIIESFEERSAAQLKATSNFNELQKLFVVDVDGNVYYPQEYSGSWIVGEDLYVGLTNVSNETLRKYKFFVPFPENVKFVKMENSLNDLETELDSYLSLVGNSDIVCGAYVDVEENKCVFEVVPEATQNFYDIFKKDLVSTTSDISVNRNNIVVKQGECAMADTTIIGGMSATSPTSSFSIGVCGIISVTSSSGSETIYDGVCSCGHGKTLSETVKVGGNTFGKVNVLRYQNNSNGDFSCIRMTSENDTLTNKVYGTSFSNTRNITSTTDNAAKNAVVMKFGANKGYGTGTVANNNKTITTTFNNITISLNGMCTCSIDSGSYEDGDSGGPCYISGYSFVGVYHGHTTSNFYFTPYVRFKTYFYPKTSG